MGTLILALLVGIPTVAFWVLLLWFVWALWSISGPVPFSKRKTKGST